VVGGYYVSVMAERILFRSNNQGRWYYFQYTPKTKKFIPLGDGPGVRNERNRKFCFINRLEVWMLQTYWSHHALWKHEI
jgi:hypothetical protein